MRTVPANLANERVVVFADYQNTLHALRREGRQVDLVALRDYLNEGRHLVEAFVYVPTHPDPEHRAADTAVEQRLRQHGFLTHTRPGRVLPDGQLTCDFDLVLALDAQDFVVASHPDIAVFVSSSAALADLAQRLRLQGIRVEVASTPTAVAPELRSAANGFIDLTRIGQEVDNLPVPQVAAVAPAPEPDFVFDEAVALA